MYSYYCELSFPFCSYNYHTYIVIRSAASTRVLYYIVINSTNFKYNCIVINYVLYILNIYYYCTIFISINCFIMNDNYIMHTVLLYYIQI